MNNIIAIKNLKYSYKKESPILNIESLNVSEGDLALVVVEKQLF